MEKIQWKNYGDVNPIPHGGIFVHQEDEENFRIIRLQFVDDMEKYTIQAMHVCVNDSWQDSTKVMEYAGLKHDGENVDYAIALTEYYPVANFGCIIDEYFTEKEAVKELASYGIDI
jgi:hypothetical protein